MSRLISISIIFLFQCIMSCGHEKNTEDITISSKREITHVAKGVFWGRIECIRVYNGNIFLSDYMTNTIYCLDSNFNLIRTIGKEGNGPGEFIGVRSFEIKENKIIAYQDRGRKISIFDLEGEYLSNFTSPIQHMGTYSFAVDNNNNLYISSPRKDHPISIVNAKGEIIGGFGEWFMPENKGHKISRNYRHLKIDSDGNLICVYVTEPIIEKYSLDGQLLSRFDLSDNLYISERLKYIEEKYAKEKPNPLVVAVYTLFSNICIKDDFLYLLYRNTKTTPSNMLVIENIKEKFIFKNNITLRINGDKIPRISKFCLNDANEIIDYDYITGSVFQFDAIKNNQE